MAINEKCTNIDTNHIKAASPTLDEKRRVSLRQKAKNNKALAAYPKMDLRLCSFRSLSTSDVGKVCVSIFGSLFFCRQLERDRE